MYWLRHGGDRVALRAGARLALGPYEVMVLRADDVSRLAELREQGAREAHVAQAERMRERELERARREAPSTPFVGRFPPEAALLRELRANPQDDATLEVYADYLEENGEPEQVALARLELELEPDASATTRPVVSPRDAMWRAVVTRPPIDHCVTFANACPERWDRLTPIASDDVRHCGVCDRQVFYCTSLARAHELGSQGACIAIDATMTRDQARASYDQGARPIVLGRPAAR